MHTVDMGHSFIRYPFPMNRKTRTVHSGHVHSGHSFIRYPFTIGELWWAVAGDGRWWEIWGNGIVRGEHTWGIWAARTAQGTASRDAHLLQNPRTKYVQPYLVG